LKDLQKDKQQLSLLHDNAKAVTPERDAKLKELKLLIERKVKNPTTNKHGELNKKVIVFTAFADTAEYLFQALLSWAHKDLGIHIALVTGGGNQTTFGKTDFNQILTNFSPRSKNRAKIPSMAQVGEIDLLIATDCISEGQNLQDCDYLVNYDIHWNPVRIIQRFGRIDRIGSVNATVQLVNFWPTQDLEKYVNLKNRVEARMALVDISATFDDTLIGLPEMTQSLLVDPRVGLIEKEIESLYLTRSVSHSKIRSTKSRRNGFKRSTTTTFPSSPSQTRPSQMPSAQSSRLSIAQVSNSASSNC
jgi:ERCC4-related helicase